MKLYFFSSVLAGLLTISWAKNQILSFSLPMIKPQAHLAVMDTRLPRLQILIVWLIREQGLRMPL